MKKSVLYIIYAIHVIISANQSPECVVVLCLDVQRVADEEEILELVQGCQPVHLVERRNLVVREVEDPQVGQLLNSALQTGFVSSSNKTKRCLFLVINRWGARLL